MTVDTTLIKELKVSCIDTTRQYKRPSSVFGGKKKKSRLNEESIKKWKLDE